MLADTNTRFEDLGADHYTCFVNPDTKKRNYIRQLEALGYPVTLTPSRLTCHPPAGPTGGRVIDVNPPYFRTGVSGGRGPDRPGDGQTDRAVPLGQARTRASGAR
jgi:hypothetical protein